MFTKITCGLFLFTLCLPLSNSLCQEPVSLEPIVITRSHLSQATYLLDTENLASSPSSSFMEALRYSPLELQRRGARGAQADFSLRGSSFEGVLILLNGRRINDPQTGHFNYDIPFTREDIRQMKVSSGSRSPLSGPNAVGGALEMSIKTPDTSQAVFESSIGLNQAYANLLSITRAGENAGMRFSAESKDSGGWRDDTDMRSVTNSCAAFIESQNARLSLNAGYQEKEFGAYDFYTPGRGFASREWTKTFLVQSEAAYQAGNASVNQYFSWRRHLDKFMLDKTGQRSLYLNHHCTDVYTPGIEFKVSGGIPDALTAGAEFTEERIRSTNLGNHGRSRESFSLGAEHLFNDALFLEGGASIDDCTEPGGSLTYKLNASLQASRNLSLRAGVSSHTRIPSFTELYYSDPTTVSNPELSAESSRDYEAGFDYKTQRHSCAITLFVRRENDFIDWIKRSGSQAAWKAENITQARTAGIEASVRSAIGGNAEIEGMYSYADRQVEDEGYLYKYGINYARHRFASILYVRALGGVQAIGFTYTKKPARDAWCLMNARFEYPLNGHTLIFLTLDNLFNSEYQEIEGIPQPKRSAECGLRLRW